MLDQLVDPPSQSKHLAAAEFFLSLKKTASGPVSASDVRAAARQSIRDLVPTNSLPTAGALAASEGKRSLVKGLPKALRG